MKRNKLTLIVLAFCLLAGFAGCNKDKEIEKVNVTYYYNEKLVYTYRAYAEYDSIRFWGCSHLSYEDAKESLLDKIREYAKATPTPKSEEVEL